MPEGKKQRGYSYKEDLSLPTVLTETMILTSMINTIEEREIAIVDIPNAFIQTVLTDKEKRVIVLFAVYVSERSCEGST